MAVSNFALRKSVLTGKCENSGSESPRSRKNREKKFSSKLSRKRSQSSFLPSFSKSTWKIGLGSFFAEFLGENQIFGLSDPEFSDFPTSSDHSDVRFGAVSKFYPNAEIFGSLFQIFRKICFLLTKKQILVVTVYTIFKAHTVHFNWMKTNKGFQGVDNE